MKGIEPLNLLEVNSGCIFISWSTSEGMNHSVCEKKLKDCNVNF